jgi:hypothetical protein
MRIKDLNPRTIGRLLLVMVPMFLLGWLSIVQPWEKAEGTSEPPGKDQESAKLSAPGSTQTMLPLVENNYPAHTPFGVQMSIKPSRGLNEAVDANTHWAHGPGIPWAKVEPNEGDRNWGELAGLEQELLNAVDNDLVPIVAIVRAPDWADAGGKTCGPIEPEDLDAFADFMYDVVNRYSKDPYHVKYWEIWNEPDVDPDLVWYGSWLGCWGDDGDPYSGGGYYADMLKVVYPKIKQADPYAQVLLGGLLLNCDPSNPPPWPPGEDCHPAHFFEGVIRNGGADYFDIVAFHGYPNYKGAIEDWEITFSPSWEPRGGVVVGKANFLSEVMANYGVDKPLFQVEGGLYCAESPEVYCDGGPTAEFMEAQAAYVPRLFVRNWAEGYMGTIWFSLIDTGWGQRFEGMLDSDKNPRDSYYAFQFMTTILEDYGYQSTISIADPLVGYRFVKGSSTIDVYWSPTGSSGTVTLPTSGSYTIYDKLGNTISATDTVDVDYSPIYIVKTP